MTYRHINRRGQSTIEYVLIVAVVLGLIIAALTPGSPLQSGIARLFQRSGERVDASATTFDNSAPVQPTVN